MSTANKYHVFHVHELLAAIALVSGACWAVYPENRLTELVLAEDNSPVVVKYLESIVRLKPENGKYRILLSDSYLRSGKSERAMEQLTALQSKDPATRFSRDIRVLALYKQDPERFNDPTGSAKLTDRTFALIRLEISRQRLGGIYSETASIGLWPAALAAAERILPFETWNIFFWLNKAASAAEQAGEPVKAAGYYIKAAACAPDINKRRDLFRKAFLVLAAAGRQKELKVELAASARAFAGDRHTAATLLTFARQTGDAYFARDIALIILRREP